MKLKRLLIIEDRLEKDLAGAITGYCQAHGIEAKVVVDFNSFLKMKDWGEYFLIDGRFPVYLNTQTVGLLREFAKKFPQSHKFMERVGKILLRISPEGVVAPSPQREGQFFEGDIAVPPFCGFIVDKSLILKNRLICEDSIDYCAGALTAQIVRQEKGKKYLLFTEDPGHGSIFNSLVSELGLIPPGKENYTIAENAMVERTPDLFWGIPGKQKLELGQIVFSGLDRKFMAYSEIIKELVKIIQASNF